MMPGPWNSEEELPLVEKVRAIPALWDTIHADYCKKLLRKQLYKKIAEALQAAVPDNQRLDVGMQPKSID